MKNLSILTLIQALLSLVSGILISKMSFIGKIGGSTFYSQYAVFKTWWKNRSRRGLSDLYRFYHYGS